MNEIVFAFIVIVAALWIREYLIDRATCKHKVKLSYHSRKEFQCCDCGKRLPMVYDDYPRHQR